MILIILGFIALGAYLFVMGAVPIICSALLIGTFYFIFQLCKSTPDEQKEKSSNEK
ncbi:hypothetical protein [Atopobium fossor]|uniref:hypothetical protein n=1 Tax=Atopobium fossor TaxID=39487 RepID=UPI0004280BB0|nr:hypothetical protein [Atopobium fossor]